MPIERLMNRVKRELFRPAATNLVALDGLRGFASCIVVFYHCSIFMGYYSRYAADAEQYEWIVRLTNGFWTGIDIFFVLSGFLIGRMLMLDLVRKGRLYYTAFILRRSFRIFPAYYLVISISLFVIAPLGIPVFNFLYGTGDWNELLNSSWANYFYLVNYVRPGNEPSILSWAWSLCVEEHFYLILPPVLWLLFRCKSSRVRLPGLVALVLLPFLGRAVQYAINPSLQLLEGFYYYSHNRFDEIFIGVLIAYFYVNHYDCLRANCERLGGWILGGAGLAGVGLVWIYGGLQKEGMFVVVFQFFVMAASTGLILLNGLFLNNQLTRFFSHPLWYPLARISYGTYLVHPFILFWLLHVFRDYTGAAGYSGGWLIPFFLAVMMLSSIVAALMFVVLEAPMLRVGANLAKKYRS